MTISRPRKEVDQRFISAGNLFGHFQKNRVFVNRQFEVALVVERHGGNLPQRIFAVEHPAIGARKQGVGDISDAVFNRRVGFCRRAGSLNPLPLQIRRNNRAFEMTVAGILNVDGCPRNRTLSGSRKGMRFIAVVAGRPAVSVEPP
jgi:hypothetical protein